MHEKSKRYLRIVFYELIRIKLLLKSQKVNNDRPDYLWHFVGALNHKANKPMKCLKGEFPIP